MHGWKFDILIQADLIAEGGQDDPLPVGLAAPNTASGVGGVELMGARMVTPEGPEDSCSEEESLQDESVEAAVLMEVNSKEWGAGGGA